MSTPPQDSLRSEPAAEQAERPPVEGPAYPTALRTLATVMVASVGVSAWRAREQLQSQNVSGTAAALVAAAAVLVLSGYLSIMVTRVRIDSRGLHRVSGPIRRSVAYTDVVQVKLIKIPGLTWLVVPRLLIKTRGFGTMVFPAGDRLLLSEFEALAFGEGASVRPRDQRT